MKVYKIYTHPAGQIEAVKQGWSWPGFFFGGFWALFKKMWGVAALVFGGAIAAAALAPLAFGSETHVLDIISIIIGLILGWGGNGWREANLRKRGYECAGDVEGQNVDSAIASFKKGAAPEVSEPQSA